MSRALVIVSCLVAFAVAGCRDLQRFSTHGDHFEGDIAKASFIRAGFDDNVKVCLALDAERLQEVPGTLSSTDGRFRSTALRPIPQLWHDPLATLEFGQGRVKNVVYAATPASGDAGASSEDVMVVVSLMESNEVEVRVLRGAPLGGDAGPSPSQLFGVFRLQRREGPCGF